MTRPSESRERARIFYIPVRRKVTVNARNRVPHLKFEFVKCHYQENSIICFYYRKESILMYVFRAHEFQI
jgi:hypothetical protein